MGISCQRRDFWACTVSRLSGFLEVDPNDAKVSQTQDATHGHLRGWRKARADPATLAAEQRSPLFAVAGDVGECR